MNSFMTIGVAASIGALGVSPLPPPPEPPPAVVSPDVELAAASVPLGAIPLAFLNNQLTFCGLICPSIVQLVTTVPIGVAQAPLSFVEALQSGSILRAIGAAAESVTSPADIATAGIINPDVFIVVPKALGTTLEVAVVQAINVGEAVLKPGQLVPAIETARQKILEALNEPATFPPSDLSNGAQGLLENVAVAAVGIPVAVAFQAGELLLAGVVHTANVAATELADTGNIGDALAAGGAAATAVIGQAGGLVADAVGTAVTGISGSLHTPGSLRAPGSLHAPSEVTTAKATTPKPLKRPADPQATRLTSRNGPVATAVKSATQNVNQVVHRVSTKHADRPAKAPKGKHRSH